ncbi:ABC transporter ATP-binding protein [Parafrigoribacterium mesophilum]|uniref:ABC transporter ATP-binding protein n=1 Tax=Parafrigoribacterium mesophilum TaxID=433646 RepID=UPI0031FD9689
MMNSDPVIVIDSLRIRRDKREVLHGIDVAVTRGAVVGLLGPSGCGKTTLMRTIVGTQKIDAGIVTVLGKPAGHPSLRRRIGYDTQEASVYDDLTVRQNFAYFRSILGVPRSEIDRVAQATDLTGQLNQLVASLSGGQRSRVSLAVALLGSPELLVLDEPTVGLDPVLRVQLWNLFRDLAAAGSTLLVSSHVMDEATRCDRLLLMRDGELLADTTPTGLLEETETRDAESAFLALIARHPKHKAA